VTQLADLLGAPVAKALLGKAVCRALAPCAFARGTCAHVQRRIGRRYGMPCPASHSQSSWTSLAVTCSACHVLPAMDRYCSAPEDRRSLSLAVAHSSWTGLHLDTNSRSPQTDARRTSSRGSRSVPVGRFSTKFSPR